MDNGKLGYFWEHVYLKSKSGPNLGGIVNPDSLRANLLLSSTAQNVNCESP